MTSQEVKLTQADVAEAKQALQELIFLESEQPARQKLETFIARVGLQLEE